VAGKNESEARDNFVHFLRETLTCITTDYLTAFKQSDKLYKVWFRPPAQVRLNDGGIRIISITQVFNIVRDRERGGHKAKTEEYSYRFSEDSDLASAGIVSYHWHPHEFEVRTPHLHITSVPRVHFPTSRVCLEDFVRLLIDYYDVRPALPDSEWKEILKRNKAAFDKMATWKIQHS
jgi:hypothetical protein